MHDIQLGTYGQSERDAGHEMAAERPEAFSSLTADFLQRHEAFIVTQKSSLLNP